MAGRSSESGPAGSAPRALAIRFSVSEERVVALAASRVRFPPGTYVYAGRGHPRPVARVSAPRADIDRALALASGVVQVRAGDDSSCALAARIARLPDALPVVGFGTSGCDCLTHLYGFLAPGSAPPPSALARVEDPTDESSSEREGAA